MDKITKLRVELFAHFTGCEPIVLIDPLNTKRICFI
jgi:hypothetical protein